MAYEKQVWSSNELITAEKLNHIEDGIALAVNPDVVNNLTETTTGKVLDATQGKILNDSKLENNFSTLSVASTPYNGNEQIALYSGGTNYSTTVNELLSAAGGSGTTQGALVNYVKNCGTISSLPVTINDSNITSDMVVIESVLGTPSAQTDDWTITTANGSVTISGSISGSTTLILYFGVGMTTAPSIMTNLTSTSSDNILKTAPRPGVMGTLGYANGGTNVVASSKQDLLDKMGVTAAIEQSTAFLSEDGYQGQQHNNLNTLYADMLGGTFGMSLYHYADNAPTTGDGLVISQKASDNYGGQFAITDSNVYYRSKYKGTWSDWFVINNQIKVKTLNVDYSVSANGSYNTNLKTLIDADLPSGHKCIGISGFITNDVNVLPISIRYADSQYSLQVRSISSSSITNHVDVYYMYTPN